MGLLQEPRKALEQVEWYLDHRENEKFPGALELAAGNLCRQVLEQILFILCFFSRMPKERYFRKDHTLRTAGQLIRKLDECEQTNGKTYWAAARRRGPRIRKFARYPRVLKAWQRELNEPSHFSAKFRKIDEAWLRSFVQRVSTWFDEQDKYLVVAAANELLSNGRIQATLSTDPTNTPGVSSRVIITPSNLVQDGRGSIALCSPRLAIRIISGSEIPRGAWPRKIVLVRHCVGMRIGAKLVTKHGDPINVSDMGEVLHSLAKTSGQKAALTRRLRRLGFEISWGRAIKEKN